MFLVWVPSRNCVLKKHVDQLRKDHLDLSLSLEIEVPKTEETDISVETQTGIVKNETVDKEPLTLRRTKRNVKPPERFGL